MASCYDCDLQYEQDDGFEDLEIPNDIWCQISPTGDDGGILCAVCMCRRLTKAGFSNIPGAFMSGPIDTVSPHLMQAYRVAENCWERVQNMPRVSWDDSFYSEPE